LKVANGRFEFAPFQGAGPGYRSAVQSRRQAVAMEEGVPEGLKRHGVPNSLDLGNDGPQARD